LAANPRHPATTSLAVAFAGFDGAAARLAATIDYAGYEPDDDRLAINVELSALLWFARSAVEHLAQNWTGGWSGFLAQLDAADNDLLNAFRWARNHAGHALARTSEDAWVPGRAYLDGFFHAPAQLWWLWAPRPGLPEGMTRNRDGQDAYDGELASRDVRPSIQAMAAWLVTADRRLATMI
jgi:hypothetical protein